MINDRLTISSVCDIQFCRQSFVKHNLRNLQIKNMSATSFAHCTNIAVLVVIWKAAHISNAREIPILCVQNIHATFLFPLIFIQY